MTPNEVTPTVLDKTMRVKEEYEVLLPKLSVEEFESLKKSIGEIGMLVPLIVNQDGILLDGHHRYRACKELGLGPATKNKAQKI